MLKPGFISSGFLLLILMLSACSATESTVVERVLFPRPPDEAKIEYIGSYYSDKDVKSAKVDLMAKYVLGEIPSRALFVAPVDVASDNKGRVFVTDSASRSVVVLDFVNSQARTIYKTATAGALERRFNRPFGVAVDANGRLYVCDVENQSVEVFDAQERYLFSIEDPGLARPTNVAVDTQHQRIYVVDTAKHRLGIFDMSGVLLRYMGGRGVGPEQFNYPTDVDIDAQGQIYVLDSLNARVQVFDETGAYLRMFGERGTATGSFTVPKNLAVASSGQVFVTDSMHHKLVIFSLEGELLLRLGGKAELKRRVVPGGFLLPRGVDVDDSGAIWVVDSLNRIVHRFQLLTQKYLSEHPL